MDDATAMLRTSVGFIEWLEIEIGQHILSFPYKIHEESLCDKVSARQLNEIECYGEYHKYKYSTFSFKHTGGLELLKKINLNMVTCCHNLKFAG